MKMLWEGFRWLGVSHTYLSVMSETMIGKQEQGGDVESDENFQLMELLALSPPASAPICRVEVGISCLQLCQICLGGSKEDSKSAKSQAWGTVRRAGAVHIFGFAKDFCEKKI